MSAVIDRFTGPYTFLSNFFWHPVPERMEGGAVRVWPSAEAMFQAQKFPHDPDYQETIRHAPSSGVAKSLGNDRLAHPASADWNDQRLDAMRRVLAAKFSDPGLAERLLATGDAVLIEGNYHGDVFWGCEWNGITQEWDGENWLGTLLVELRHKLAQALPTAVGVVDAPTGKRTKKGE